MRYTQYPVQYSASQLASGTQYSQDVESTSNLARRRTQALQVQRYVTESHD